MSGMFGGGGQQMAKAAPAPETPMPVADRKQQIDERKRMMRRRGGRGSTMLASGDQPYQGQTLG